MHKNQYQYILQRHCIRKIPLFDDLNEFICKSETIFAKPLRYNYFGGFYNQSILHTSFIFG